MKERPIIGQVVRLNNYGIEQINGLSSLDMIEQAKRMVITDVSVDSLTNDVETFSISVDQPLINQFMIDNHCVDLIDERS